MHTRSDEIRENVIIDSLNSSRFLTSRFHLLANRYVLIVTRWTMPDCTEKNLFALIIHCQV